MIRLFFNSLSSGLDSVFKALFLATLLVGLSFSAASASETEAQEEETSTGQAQESESSEQEAAKTCPSPLSDADQSDDEKIKALVAQINQLATTLCDDEIRTKLADVEAGAPLQRALEGILADLRTAPTQGMVGAIKALSEQITKNQKVADLRSNEMQDAVADLIAKLSAIEEKALGAKWEAAVKRRAAALESLALTGGTFGKFMELEDGDDNTTPQILRKLLPKIAVASRYDATTKVIEQLNKAAEITVKRDTTPIGSFPKYHPNNDTNDFVLAISDIANTINGVRNSTKSGEFEAATDILLALLDTEQSTGGKPEDRKKAVEENKRKILGSKKARQNLGKVADVLQTLRSMGRPLIRVRSATYGDLRRGNSHRRCDGTKALRKLCDGKSACPKGSDITIEKLCGYDPVPRAPDQHVQIRVHYHCLVGDLEKWDALIRRNNGRGVVSGESDTPNILGSHTRTFTFKEDWELRCRSTFTGREQ